MAILRIPVTNTLKSMGVLLPLCAALAIVGCGGGDSSTTSSTATPTQSSTTASNVLADGTITGFGSVYVDGVAYDDSQVKAVERDESGKLIDSGYKLGLGQRVHIEHDGLGDKPKVMSLIVETAVKGNVSAVSADTLTVLGQTVRINSDSSAGPVTVFAGNATTLADIQVKEYVRVYGSRNADGDLVATRIEEVAASAAERASVNATITAVSATQITVEGLTIDASNANILPVGTTLQVGDVVTAWGTLSTSNNGVLVATTVTKRTKLVPEKTLQKIRLAGVVSDYVAGQSFVLAGKTITLNSTTQYSSALANNVYARVEGALQTDGSIVATKVESSKIDTNRIMLAGDIADYDNTAKTMTVRGVSVTIANATVTGNCTLADGTAVKVKGDYAADTGMVTAKEVACVTTSGVIPTVGMHRHYKGVIRSVNSIEKSFVVNALFRGEQRVYWDDNTRFEDGLSADTLPVNTRMVDVEAVIDDQGRLLAKEIGADLHDQHRR